MSEHIHYVTDDRLKPGPAVQISVWWTTGRNGAARKMIAPILDEVAAMLPPEM